MKEIFYTTAQAGAKIDKDQNFMSKMIREKKIKAVKVGNTWKISESALNEFLGLENNKEDVKQQLYIQRLESEVKSYKQQLSMLKNILNSATNIIGG